MSRSKIEWCDRVWNPVTGCSRVSAGCANCYAERMSKRLAGRCGYPADEPFRVTLHPDRLDQPLRWRKPKMVFVCSMGDLFHEDVPERFLDIVFLTMAGASRHTFQVLTKRPARMRAYLSSNETAGRLITTATAYGAEVHAKDSGDGLPGIRFKNIMLGVSVEDQATANARIPHLLATPAAVRFVSVEPMLGAVDLTNIRLRNDPLDTDSNPAILNAFTASVHHPQTVRFAPLTKGAPPGVHWVIAGSESGPRTRPCHPDWFRSLRDQCQSAGVPYFLKQMKVYGKLVKMPELDGRTWDEWPEVTE